MTLSPSPPPTLAQLVIGDAARAGVLERFGLDYCCGGQRALDEACAAAGVDPMTVRAALDEVHGDETVDVPSEPAALAEFIEKTHHAYLHTELPALSSLAAKVRGAHAGRHPELVEVERLVGALADDLVPHLVKEERVLFPAIRALLAGRREFPFGTVRNPIRMMSLEHDSAGELLAELRATTRGYLVPDDGCPSYRSLFGRLAHLEADTHRHIHLENNVLFPAAVAIEAG